jgi:hypothetical protein
MQYGLHLVQCGHVQFILYNIGYKGMCYMGYKLCAMCKEIWASGHVQFWARNHVHRKGAADEKNPD